MRKILIALVVAAMVWCAPAARAGDVAYVSGGCGSGNIGLYGNPYMTVDAAGRNCIGLYYSYANITTDTTTTVKSSAGVLHAITFNNPVATETLTIYDNTAASGTKIGTVTVPASPQPVTLTYDVAFANGLTIVTATAASDITVSYK